MKITTRPESIVQSAILSAFLLILTIGISHADSGTWLLNPVNGDWDNPANWSSGTVPGFGDTATFSVSNQTSITFSATSNDVHEIVFQPDAGSYQFTARFDQSLTISNGGIDNESTVVQTFILRGNHTAIGPELGAQITGLVQFISEPPSRVGGFNAAIISGGAHAGSATFTNKGGIVAGATGGETDFQDVGLAENANITNEAAVVAGASGGLTVFLINSSSAEQATITCEGATVAGAGGGITQFFGESRAGRGTLIALGGSNGGEGGTIQFWDHSHGIGSHIQVFGNGNLDISHVFHIINPDKELSIGTLEGDGLVFLGSHQLAIRDNSLNTTFSGIIQDGGSNGGTGGSLSKIGRGTLTLTSANTYTGGTMIEGGKLVVNNRSGSGTGTGTVQVNAGILAGRGTISGQVIVGTGSGAGASVAPGGREGNPDTLTTQDALTFNSDGSYQCDLNSTSAIADEVVANGVTINGGQFSLLDSRGLSLPTGTVLTVIDNISANAISGTFANLADDSTITVGNNTFQASYEGGDGNDLTLTVVP